MNLYKAYLADRPIRQGEDGEFIDIRSSYSFSLHQAIATDWETKTGPGYSGQCDGCRRLTFVSCKNGYCLCEKYKDKYGNPHKLDIDKTTNRVLPCNPCKEGEAK